MGILCVDEVLEIEAKLSGADFFEDIERQLFNQLPANAIPVRFVVTSQSSDKIRCEVGVIRRLSKNRAKRISSIFRFRERAAERTSAFTTALVVPTGVGAEVGGHAGDAGPAATLLAQLSDQLILHPNVVNASDINEMPPNSLYVEGSVVSRLLMGTVSLHKVRSNRVLAIIDHHDDELFINAAINTVNAARATYGLQCAEVISATPQVKLRARFSTSGRASGLIDGFEGVLDVIEGRRGAYDAIAFSTVIDVPSDYHLGYFDAAGSMVNPWGGVEAMFTHAVSSLYDIPTAHSPMFESREIANLDPGIVDPRMAAEAVSTTFLQCTLKGLQRSPRISSHDDGSEGRDKIGVEDVSCLVIPDGCIGLPTLAALKQGITVIAVRENANISQTELSHLPWRPGQFLRVENYWEAAGVIAAIRGGIDPYSVRRPFRGVKVSQAHGEEAKGPYAPTVSGGTDTKTA